MCGLFGIYNYSGYGNKAINDIVNNLAYESMVRGTDATGISYNRDGHLVIYKRNLSADYLDFNGLEKCFGIIGHTRHSTQGNASYYGNNHPFSGHAGGTKFALAHNGVLYNDVALRNLYNIAKNKIETDSYIAVQLLEFFGKLSPDNFKAMAESVKGSFSFSILDDNDVLTLVKGDSPITLLHFPDKQIYIYASTDSILYKALIDTPFFDDVKNGKTEEIKLHAGDIWQINTKGKTSIHKFDFVDDWYDNRKWYEYGDYYSGGYADTETETETETDPDLKWLEDIKSIAKYYGYLPEEIDDLYYGYAYSLDEIEELIYGYTYSE